MSEKLFATLVAKSSTRKHHRRRIALTFMGDNADSFNAEETNDQRGTQFDLSACLISESNSS